MRHALPADAVEAVAAADEVALQLLRLAVLAEADPGAVAGEIVDGHVLGLEHDLAARGETGVDQILGHLGLTVHGHGLAGERAEIDAVPPAAEAQLDAVVHQADRAHPLANLRLIEQVDRALLEHARANPPLHVFTAAALQDHRVDALEMQELGEQKARRSGPHDANLRAHPNNLVVLARRPPYNSRTMDSESERATSRHADDLGDGDSRRVRTALGHRRVLAGRVAAAGQPSWGPRRLRREGLDGEVTPMRALPAAQVIVQPGFLEFVWFWRCSIRGAGGARDPARLGAQRLERGQRAEQLGKHGAAIAHHRVKRTRAVAVAHQPEAERLLTRAGRPRRGRAGTGRAMPPRGDRPGARARPRSRCARPDRSRARRRAPAPPACGGRIKRMS